MKVTGPHSLQFITDEQLVKGEIDVGEIGDVHDAQEQWIHQSDM